ncbi:TetR/AcrR family transcriptional regulator [Streptomyces sp. BE303]|uniref:TetR/AcrR family transcriptional regulator n=1 Tax=Streptomyces sp. BE303 TaxID=3002528 RepID=UPI002E7A0F90|nr:TetR/AcrR family transcriptional regulator [Streptomyces sp. BE303]MED7948898.1 TetR/AcrR family transcriptional regulator [Streptomyces sp. BE303]
MATAPTRLPKAARREQLLDTAMAIVRVRGADGLTLATLAEAAGVSRPIAYDHFGTRPGLLLALYRRLDERHRASVAQALQDAAPTVEEVARVISAAYFACATDMPELNAVSAALKGDPDMEAGRQEMTDSYADLMAAALRPYTHLEPDTLRLYCAGALGAAEALAAVLNRGRASEDDVTDTLTDLVVGGLQARTDSR